MRMMKIVVCRLLPIVLLLLCAVACGMPSSATPTAAPTFIRPTVTIAPPTAPISTPTVTRPALNEATLTSYLADRVEPPRPTQVPVANRPQYQLIASPTDDIAPLLVTFEIQHTGSSSLACATQNIDFGDGTIEQRIIPPCPGAFGSPTPTPQPVIRVVTHVYAQAGRYVAMICIETPCEASGRVTITVH